MKKQLFLVVVAALAMASCSKDESTGINNGNAIDFRAAMQTRASETTMANITNFFVTALDKNNANYFSDAEFTKDGAFFTSTPAYYWPSDGSNLSFFAYAPYGGQGIVLSDKTSAGTPSITYTVPTAVADQQDLLVAATSGMAGNTAAAAPLSFAHALTAVRFTTGDDMMSGRITKITLKGVYGSGSHTMGSDSWNGYGATTDFSQTLAATVDGSADQEITPVAATFMMLPQTLPSGASIEVVYTDDLTSTQRTLTASIAAANGRWAEPSLTGFRRRAS